MKQEAQARNWFCARDHLVWESKVIQLTLINERSEVLVARSAPFFRITGGNIWRSPAEGRIVRFSERGWEFQGQSWEGMRFEGPSRLIMGISRSPTAISEVLQSVSIVRDVLSANGIPFSVYEPASDMWRSALVQTWWHSFRIESASRHASVSDEAADSDVGSPKDPSQGFQPRVELN